MSAQVGESQRARRTARTPRTFRRVVPLTAIGVALLVGFAFAGRAWLQGDTDPSASPAASTPDPKASARVVDASDKASAAPTRTKQDKIDACMTAALTLERYSYDMRHYGGPQYKYPLPRQVLAGDIGGVEAGDLEALSARVLQADEQKPAGEVEGPRTSAAISGCEQLVAASSPTFGPSAGYSNAALGTYPTSTSGRAGCPLYEFGVTNSGGGELLNNDWFSVRFPGVDIVFLTASDIHPDDYPNSIDVTLPGQAFVADGSSSLFYRDGGCAITLTGTLTKDDLRRLINTATKVETSTASAKDCEDRLFDIYGKWLSKELTEAQAIAKAGAQGQAMRRAIAAMRAENYPPAGQPSIYDGCAKA